MDERYKAPHIYIVGQTASGKTGFALDLAKEVNAEIINTDSLLFYKHLDIGTAKPSKAELKKVKHHIVDVAEIGEEYSAATYEAEVIPLLKESNKNYLCVGGSGFYIKSIDVGLLPLPETDASIKEEVLSMKDPIKLLKEVDPETLEKISENDLYRVNRALEVFKQTGKPLSIWKKEFDPKPYAKKIAFFFEREELLKRVKERTKIMLKSGLIDETKKVLDVAGENWKPLQSIGYKQVLEYLSGDIPSLNELEDLIVTRTMQLAKRQKTWFKADSSVKWFDSSQREEALIYAKELFKENRWRV